MQPTFRQDLTCTRDDQDGVVYYQVEDPKAQASFRLYEIEYRIACALDGKRSLQEVAETIKRDYDFEISDGDLLKFVGQLKQMNFVIWDDADTAPSSPPDLAAFGDTPPELLENVATMELSLADVGLPLDAAAPETGTDLAGAQQMLVSGLTHIRQGELAHAKDFLLAVMQKDPERLHIDRLVELIDGLGGGATAMELASLWQQCEVWFPEVVGTLGPVREPRRTTGVQPRPVASRKRHTSSAVFETFVGGAAGLTGGKPWLLGVGLLVVVLAAGGIFYLVWNGATGVRGRTLEAERIPVFAPDPAIDKVSAKDVWVSFDRPGRIGEIAASGKRVGEHETLLSLALPPSQKQALDSAHAQVLAAENNLAQARLALGHVDEQRRPLERQLAEGAARLKQLQPGEKRIDPVTRGQMAKVRASMGRTKAALARVQKLSRGPQSTINRYQAQLTALRHKQSGLEARFAVQRRTAPFAGEVTEVRVKVGDAIRPGQPLMHLQDPSLLHIKFAVFADTKLKAGDEAAVVADAGAPLVVKVHSLLPNKQQPGFVVTVVLRDPAGALLHLDAKVFHLIERFVEPAYHINARALIRGANAHQAQVLLMRRGHVEHHTVQILSDVDGEAVIFDPNGGLPDRSTLIVSQGDGAALGALTEGAEVDVVPP